LIFERRAWPTIPPVGNLNRKNNNMNSERKELPPGLSLTGSSRFFDEKTIPPPLLESHTLSEGKWAVIVLLEGSVWYVDLERNEETLISSKEKYVVAPNAPHKLRIEEPMSCRIDFYK